VLASAEAGGHAADNAEQCRWAVEESSRQSSLRGTDGPTLVGSEPHPRKQSGLYIAGLIAVGAATVGAYVLGFTTKDAELGDFCKVILGPLLSLVVCVWATDFYHRLGASKNLERDVGKAAYSTRVMLHGVYDVDEQLREASDTLNEGDVPTATKALAVAVAMTRLSLRHVLQTLREWESLSHSAVELGEHAV
jgi:hypothetical protein